jgi:hypothetical protein
MPDRNLNDKNLFALFGKQTGPEKNPLLSSVVVFAVVFSPEPLLVVPDSIRHNSRKCLSVSRGSEL